MKEFIESLALHLSKNSVFPFMCRKADYKVRAYEVIGTGFFALYDERYYLVTARHVVDIVMERPTSILIGLKVLILQDVLFQTAPEYDLAVMEVTQEFFARNNVDESDVQAIMLSYAEPKLELGSWIVVGYVANNKNNLIPSRPNGSPPQFTSVTFTELRNRPESESKIKSGVAFTVNPKDFTNQAGNKVRLDKLNGCSGGPILRLTVDEVEGKPSRTFRCFGMLVEWHKTSNEIVVVRVEDIKKLIRQLSA